MLWTVSGLVLGVAVCADRIYSQCQIPPVLTPPDSWTSVGEHPWEGICKEPFILQWRVNLIIIREFLQVPGSTEWILPGVAGWNAANPNTMEALKKAKRLSTYSPCLFSPEMKRRLQVSRNCAFWLVFIDSEVLADRQTDRQGRVPLQWCSFFPSLSPRLSLLTLFTHCSGFSSGCQGEWQLPFSSVVLEAWVPLGSTTVRLSATYCSTSLRDVATTQSFVFILPSETWVKAGGLGQMLKVNSAWLVGVCVKEKCMAALRSALFPPFSDAATANYVSDCPTLILCFRRDSSPFCKWRGITTVSYSQECCDTLSSRKQLQYF